LADTLWSFSGTAFSEVAAFSQAVGQYQKDITKKDSWKPASVVLPVTLVLVSYNYCAGDDQEQDTLALTSANGQNFTAVDLLFQIHNGVVDRLQGSDHHFFEGLRLNSAPPPAISPPLYVLNLGS
jgi:hypothetical protein